MKILPRNFYNQPTLQVAQDLIGKILCYKNKQARIIETEAYLQNDKACHASRGITERNKIMFGKPGRAYVYFIYGMYYCLNAVTQPEGIGEAVLIRAVEPLKNLNEKADGPGKLCRAFRITKELNGTDLTKGDFTIKDDGTKLEIKKGTRIGIKQDADKEWRFYADISKTIS